MERYALGLIIQADDNLKQWRDIASGILPIFTAEAVAVDDKQSYEKFKLKDAVGAEIRVFIGIAKDVPSSLKTLVESFSIRGDVRFLPDVAWMYFGELYNLEEMKSRLKQWMETQWLGKYLILDSGSDAADLINKFQTD